jgi:hypothetical protein
MCCGDYLKAFPMQQGGSQSQGKASKTGYHAASAINARRYVIA